MVLSGGRGGVGGGGGRVMLSRGRGGAMRGVLSITGSDIIAPPCTQTDRCKKHYLAPNFV